MATIASLVVKIVGESSSLNSTLARSAKTAADFAARVVSMNAGVRTLSATTHAAADAVDDLNQKAGGYLKTLLKLGGAAAVVATAIKAAHAVDKSQSGLANAQGGPADPGNLASSYDRVQGAVTRAYEAFGTAFARSANLAKILDQLANIVTNLTPLFSSAGAALGRVASFLTSSTPAAIALLVVFKALALAVPIIAFSLFVKWLTGSIPLVWAWRAAVMAWQVVLLAVPVALNAVSAAFAILQAVGLPFWGALAVVIGVATAAMYGLYKAWQWLTRPADSVGKTAAETEKLAKTIIDATEAANKMEESLRDAVRKAELGDAASELEKFRGLLTNAGISGEQAAKRIADFDAQLAQMDAIKARTEAVKALTDAQKAARQAHMTPIEAAADDARNRGQSPAAVRALEENMRNKEAIDKYEENRKKVAEIQATINKAERQIGMSDPQKKLDDLSHDYGKTGRVTVEKYGPQMMAQLEAIEKGNKLREEQERLGKEAKDMQFDVDTIGLTAAQKRVEYARQFLGLTGQALAYAKKNAAIIDDAEKRKKGAQDAKQLLDHSLTAAQKYQKAVEDILRLRSMGDKVLTARQADQAMAAARKEAMQESGSYRFESPKAMVAGSAEAKLDQQRQQVEAAFRKQQADELEKIRKLAEDRAKQEALQNKALIAAVEANKPTER